MNRQSVAQSIDKTWYRDELAITRAMNTSGPEDALAEEKFRQRRKAAETLRQLQERAAYLADSLAHLVDTISVTGVGSMINGLGEIQGSASAIDTLCAKFDAQKEAYADWFSGQRHVLYDEAQTRWAVRHQPETMEARVVELRAEVAKLEGDLQLLRESKWRIANTPRYKGQTADREKNDSMLARTERELKSAQRSITIIGEAQAFVAQQDEKGEAK